MKQRIINLLLRKVVRVVIPEDVLSVSKGGKVMVGGIELSKTEKMALQAEAKALESMRLWSIINETIKQMAYEKGWRDSTTMEHLNTAKTMYSVLETQKSVVDKLKGTVV